VDGEGWWKTVEESRKELKREEEREKESKKRNVR
jgi:hypothetical protein